MPTISRALTTLAKVKTYRSISVATHDALLESFINEVTNFIEGVTGGRRFEEASYVEEYEKPNGYLLFLNQSPITEVTKVEWFSGTLASPVWTEASVEEYQAYLKEGYIKFFIKYHRSKSGLREIRVTYDAGYLVDFINETDEAKHTLPFDLTLLATQLVAKAFDQRFAQGKASETVEGSAINWSNMLTAEQTAVINKYQRHYIGS